MQNDDKPMKKFGNIAPDDKRSKTPKTAKAKEAEARKNSIQSEKRP